MRIGFGYDSHRFIVEKNTISPSSTDSQQPTANNPKPLILGGIEFPGEAGLKGHSDADVLIHAIIDALLGAAALGDIGSHFPDTDPKWQGADSAKLLEAVVKEIRSAGYQVGNVDATIICERPKLRPFIEMIRERLASVMNVGKGRVSIKGKTNEKMDDVGAGVGIEVHAVALLEER